MRGFPRVAAEAAPHPVQCGPLSLQLGIHFLYFHISAGNLYSVAIFPFSKAMHCNGADLMAREWLQGYGYEDLGVTNLCDKES